MNHWLIKSEPEVFSIADLAKAKQTLWDGVRNYQARNFMMQQMKIGDPILFYHSNAEPSGVAGLAKVVGPALPDPTQFDQKSEYFDKKASRAKPIWFGVQVGFVEQFDKLISLDEIREEEGLRDMLLLRKGQRLSVQPVDLRHYKRLVLMATKTPESK